MKKFVFCFPVLIAGSFFLSSCSGPASADADSEVKQTGSDLLEVKKEAQDGYFEEFQRFKQMQVNKLNEIENRIEAYKKSLPKELPQTTVVPNKDVANAEHQLAVLRKKLEEFTEEGKDKLSKFEQDFSKDLTDLNESVNKFAPVSKS